MRTMVGVEVEAAPSRLQVKVLIVSKRQHILLQ